MVCCCTNHPTCAPVKQRQMKGVCGGGNKPHSPYYTVLSVTYNTLSANALKISSPLKQASVKGLLRFS